MSQIGRMCHGVLGLLGPLGLFFRPIRLIMPIGLILCPLRLILSQKNFVSSPTISLSSMLASRLVPRRSHLLVSHFSPRTSFTMV